MSRTATEKPGDPEKSDFGEKGPDVADTEAGKSEEEKLEGAVDDLKSDPE